MTSTDPRQWTPPRPLDPSERLRRHGPIRPMPRPSLLERLFGSR